MAELDLGIRQIGNESADILTASLGAGYVSVIDDQRIGIEFPPEPSVLTMATLAVANSDATIGHSMVSGFDPSGIPSRSTVISMYDAMMVRESGLGRGTEASDFVQMMSAEVTLRAGKRLVAAHIIVRVPGSNRLFGTVMYSPAFEIGMGKWLKKIASDELPSDPHGDFLQPSVTDNPMWARSGTHVAIMDAMPTRKEFRALSAVHYRAN